jgi:hypothetical protein
MNGFDCAVFLCRLNLSSLIAKLNTIFEAHQKRTLTVAVINAGDDSKMARIWRTVAFADPNPASSGGWRNRIIPLRKHFSSRI